MVIFNFRSDGGRGLFAFAAQRDGGPLPERHGPWTLVENIGLNKKMPHAFDRKTVEDAIEANGYQLWRLKSKATSA